MKKRGTVLAAVLLSIALMTAACGGSSTESTTAETTTAAVSEETADGTVKIALNGTDAEISGEGASIADGKLTITSAGTYELSGSFDGQILVDVGADDEVNLILNGVTLTTDGNYAICAVDGKKLTVTLSDGAKNILNVNGVNTDESAEEEEDKADAAIYAKDELLLTGEGSLEVNASGKAFHTADALTVEYGTYMITSVDDAFNGENSVTVEDGTFDVTITNAEEGKGITSLGDVVLDGGDFTLNESNEGIEGLTVTVNDGIWNLTAVDDGINGREETEDDTADAAAESSETSESESSDETSAAASGSGETTAAASGSGQMTAQTGTDSGMPHNGFGGGAGQQENGEMEYNEKAQITINGGTVMIDAGGDGMDSNGDITMNGGEVYVSGSADDMDAALDTNGSTTVNGGTLFASGMQGMLESISEDSEQAVLTVYCDSTLAAGTEVSVTDDSGTEIMSWTVPKDCNVLQLSAAAFEDGKTFTVTTGDSSQEVQISGMNTTLGTAQQASGAGSMGGNNGQPPQGGPAQSGAPSGNGAPGGPQDGSMTPPSGGNGESPQGAPDGSAPSGDMAPPDGGNGQPPQGGPQQSDGSQGMVTPASESTSESGS